jgi:ABC-type phosphate/phosphonate transport system substrate-binding protein
MEPRKLVLGAVAYDAKVVTIWDGFTRFFEERGLPFDYVLFTNYERQVEAHFDGVVDVAWNSPLAWIESAWLAQRLGREAHAIAMRDTDCDLTTAIVVRRDDPAQRVADVEGKAIGFGAPDSPQATLLPRAFLLSEGVSTATLGEARTFDVLVGKHGDHIGGERDAARALLKGEVDVACVLDANVVTFANEGTWPSVSVRVLGRTPAYDHCNFTVLDGAPADLVARFTELLLGMRYDDPQVRPLLDLEGLKVWKPGRTSGYAALEESAARFGTIEKWLGGQVARRTS